MWFQLEKEDPSWPSVGPGGVSSLGQPSAPGFTAGSALACSGLTLGRPLSLKVVDGVSHSAVVPAGVDQPPHPECLLWP